jgi:hypothetical protein
VNATIDEIGVNIQTEMRPKDDNVKQNKRVENTVIHIENVKGKYILNWSNIKGALKLLVGSLLHNGLMWEQIVIFADGARAIHGAVQEMLGYARVKVIMDWYHLDKKCREYMSMVVKGREAKEELLGKMLEKLWFGDVDGAIAVLGGMEQEKVKNPEKLAELTEYFGRIRPNVPCYAMRKTLGLRNSSGPGEKANDLVVARRQKHNGMAWSDDGSFAFASVSAVSLNGELLNWVRRRNFSFVLNAFSA